MNFFVEPEMVSDILTRIEKEVLPRFSRLPHFLGFVALKSETNTRPEIVALSFWDDGLEGSEEASEAFRDQVEEMTGAAPGRKTFEIIRAMVRDTDGAVCLDTSLDR